MLAVLRLDQDRGGSRERGPNVDQYKWFEKHRRKRGIKMAKGKGSSKTEKKNLADKTLINVYKYSCKGKFFSLIQKKNYIDYILLSFFLFLIFLSLSLS